MISYIPRRLPVTTAILCLGLIAMWAWEDAVGAANPVTRVGRLVLLVGIVALVSEGRSASGVWRIMRRFWDGPTRLLIVGGAVAGIAVLISSSTNGCRCGGGAQGLWEVELWVLVSAVVAFADPGSRLPLLAAATLGCVIAGVAALGGAHGPSTMAAGSTRLAGTYGNANYFAATQALALPVMITLCLRGQRMRVRSLGLAGAVLIGVTLLRSYSRSGILAGAVGAAVAILLLVPRGRRVPAGLAMGAAAAAVLALAYPTFSRERDRADLGFQYHELQQTDGSGWSRYPTGLFAHPADTLANPTTNTLRVTATRASSGASIGVGPANPVTNTLRFQARASSGRPVLSFAVEDTTVSAGLVDKQAALNRRWQTLTLRWRPKIYVVNGRAFFWAATPGSFDLRNLTLTRPGAAAVMLPVRLLGARRANALTVNQLEQRFIRSRTGAARLAVDAFLAHPLVGVGWERFPFYSATRSGVGAIAAHDDYLRFPAELGLAGLLAVGLVSIGVAWTAVRARRGAIGAALVGVLAATAVAIGFADIVETPNVILPGATALALAAAISADPRDQAEAR